MENLKEPEEWRKDLDTLKGTPHSFKEAWICWEDWKVQCFFNPESAEKDFKKRIKKAWGLKGNDVYLVVNGRGTGYSQQAWPVISNGRVVIKGLGGAEVVIEGPGGLEIELDTKTAEDWLWHCGLVKAEIKGWSYEAKLQGGERITFLVNPRQGIKVKRDPPKYYRGLSLETQLRLEDDEEHDLESQGVLVKELCNPTERKSPGHAWQCACDWVSQNGIGSITLQGKTWKFERFRTDDKIQAVTKRELPSPVYSAKARDKPDNPLQQAIETPRCERAIIDIMGAPEFG
jgi:hypothetical protein